MEEQVFFTPQEHTQLIPLYRHLLRLSGDTLQKDDCRNLKRHLIQALSEGNIPRNAFGMNPVIKDMQTAIIVAEEIGMRRASILGIMLHESVKYRLCTLESVRQMYGEDVAGIIRGLVKINELYEKNPAIESENFRNLLLSFAEDMRVILIMIADRVNIMRQIKDNPNEEARQEVSNEAAYLYAPLAHKLGLYKLNATKAARDRYIDAFIEPVKKKLEESGLKFHIKGRTKSIHSIYQKMKKQGCPFEGVYDLFAIRIILDSPLDKEKQECWQAYSIVTDMYLPNPKRLRDWLSVPKSNGYESLHITVMGPEGKWVEVQIRTERMDEIAEKGLAAHWRYKGVKGETGLDEWLNSIRETLENADGDTETIDQFKLDLYKDEVFVFSPKGDLYKLPQGATVLDFAFAIHSNLGCRCVGAKVNELCHHLEGTHQDTPGTEGTGGTPNRVRTRNLGTEIQEPQDRVRRSHPDAAHQEVGIQNRDRLLSKHRQRNYRHQYPDRQLPGDATPGKRATRGSGIPKRRRLQHAASARGKEPLQRRCAGHRPAPERHRL